MNQKKKKCPAVVPLSKSLRSPGPQTSLSMSSRVDSFGYALICPACFTVFELPNELILSILSHISPDPPLTGHYARFRVQYNTRIGDYREWRVQFLRPLSMTCKVMRLRLLPWIWEHLEPIWGNLGNLNTTVNRDRSLANNVKYFHPSLSQWVGIDSFLCRFMTLYSLWTIAKFPLFVKCLESLPNLHTLAIGWSDGYITNPLKNALKRHKFPQIKALILPPSAYPLLKRCRNAEYVDCVVGDQPIPSKQLLGFLASIRGSKVKRLAIPLISCCDTSSKGSTTP